MCWVSNSHLSRIYTVMTCRVRGKSRRASDQKAHSIPEPKYPPGLHHDLLSNAFFYIHPTPIEEINLYSVLAMLKSVGKG